MLASLGVRHYDTKEFGALRNWSKEFEMNVNSTTVNETVERTPANQATPETTPLTETLAAIRGDSQQAPALYLNETVVPHGGE